MLTSIPSVGRRLGAAFLALLIAIPPGCSSAPSPLSWAEQHGTGTPLPGFPRDPLVKSSAPITLPGAGGVTDAGAATYSLPLSVPAGPAGAQPSLTITYSSGNTNGHLGVGMGLAGVSVIVPCNQTFASEGFAHGFNFGGQDAYCLDGQKLVEVEDPDYTVPAGEVHRVYHTEVEQFARVVYRMTGTTTEWLVYPGNGSTRRYRALRATPSVGGDGAALGTPRDLRIPYAYVLDRVDDAHGNRVAYFYDENTDVVSGDEYSYRLARIEYSYSGTTARRKIVFGYDVGRPDPVVRWVRGIKLVTRSRLRTIEAWAPNPTTTARVWRYELDYTPSIDTGRSLLTSVRVCEQFGGCSNARMFRWSAVEGTDAADDFEEHVATGGVEFDATAMSEDASAWAAYYNNPNANWVPPTDTGVLLYDVDNDGDDDAVYRTSPTAAIPSLSRLDDYEVFASYLWTAGALHVRRSTAEPFDHHVDVENLEGGFTSTVPENEDDEERLNLVSLGKSRVADFDGDGDQDLLLARLTLERGPPTWIPNMTEPVYVDQWSFGYAMTRNDWWDGGDAFYNAPLTWNHTTMTGPVLYFDPQIHDEEDAVRMVATPIYQLALADLDGDHLPETVDAVHANALDYPGVDFTQFDWSDPSNPLAGEPYHTKLSSTGAAVTFNQAWHCGNGKARVLDATGDGRDDLLVLAPSDDGQGGQDHKFYGRIELDGDPAGLGSSKLWAGDCSEDADNDPDLVLGDWNGDGLVDVLYPPRSYGQNPAPWVRWNLGNGLGPLVPIAVAGIDPTALTALMEQPAPLGKNGKPVAWDHGTRVADVNGDGRSDIIAFRQNNAQCISYGLTDPSCDVKVVLYLSRGDHFDARVVWTWSDAGASAAHGFTTAQVGDTDGDGAVDLVHVAGGKLRSLSLPWRKTPDRLELVMDDSTPYPVESFTYSRQWWGELEGRRSHTGGCDYPLACAKRGFPVVRRHRVFAGTDANGDAMYRTFIHTYQGPWSDQRGRGSLGMAEHRIWDRERGVETLRYFRNDHRIDPDEATPGAEHYPYAHRPWQVTTITPLVAMPTPAQLAAYPPEAPGLAVGASVPVRMVTTDYRYDVRTSSDGRILTVLPETVTVTTADRTATPTVDTHTPSYGDVEMPDYAMRTITTVRYDDLGFPISERTGTAGGGYRASEVTYEHRRASWQLGLPTRVSRTARDADDTSSPSRIVRTTFDAAGRAERVDVKALEAGVLCPPPGDCESAEQLAVSYGLGYDSHGNQTTVTAVGTDEPVARTTTTDYDSEGIYALRVTDPLGDSDVVLRHPALGVAVLDQDAIGVQGIHQYDGFGRLVKSTAPGTATVVRSYSVLAAGARRALRIDTTRSDGSADYVELDERGRSIRLGQLGSQGSWIHVGRDRDFSGQVVRESRPTASLPGADATVTTYDRAGRMLAVVAPDGATSQMKHAALDFYALVSGELETISTDPAGHRKFVIHDRDGRVVRSGHYVGLDEYGEVRHAYKPFDQLSTVTDAGGNVLTRDYDAFGRLTQVTDPDAGTTKYTYNGFGELVSELRPTGIQLFYSRDAGGRLTAITGPEDARTFEYGTVGTSRRRLIRATSSDGVVTEHTYDSLGRGSETRQIVDGLTDRIDRHFDAQGRLAYVEYPEVTGFSRFTVRMQWGNFGHLRAVENYSACGVVASCVAAKPIWQVASRNLDQSITLARLGAAADLLDERQYDPLTAQLRAIEVGNASGTVATFNYNYTDDGLVRTRKHLEAARTETFEHDELHRLTSWELMNYQVNGGTLTEHGYAYDQLGNLLTVHRDHQAIFTGTYPTGGRPHELAERAVPGPFGAITTKFDYDAGGRQTEAGSRKTTWSDFDLPRAIDDGNDSDELRYDAGGERTVKVTANDTVTYVDRYYERHTDNAATTRHVFLVHGERGVVAQMTYTDGPTAHASQLQYFVGDHLGSTSVVLDDAGHVETHYFAPFGDRVDELGNQVTAGPLAVGFTGHEEDTGELVNMRGRIYDRSQYRFVSPDPVIGEPLFGESYNPYSYVRNSPLAFVDPTGYDGVSPDIPGGGTDPFDQDAPPSGQWNNGGEGNGAGNDDSASTYQEPSRPTDDDKTQRVTLQELLLSLDTPVQSSGGMLDSTYCTSRHCKQFVQQHNANRLAEWNEELRASLLANEEEEARAARQWQILPANYGGDPGLLGRGPMDQMRASLSSGLTLWGKLRTAWGRIESIADLFDVLTGGASGLHAKNDPIPEGWRPNLWKRTVDAVIARGRAGLPPLPEGARFQVGHIPGFENKPLVEYARAIGLTKGELREFVNLFPENYFVQSQYSNSRRLTDLGYLLPYWKDQMDAFKCIKRTPSK